MTESDASNRADVHDQPDMDVFDFIPDTFDALYDTRTAHRGAAVNVSPALSAQVGLARACAHLGLSQAKLYRQRRPKAPVAVARTPPLKLDTAEQRVVLDELMRRVSSTARRTRFTRAA